MSTDYDVVVVGAGPGGAAAATHLARGGARVLVLDRARFPRDKACGGGLTPRGVAALDRLKIDLGPDEAVEVGGLEMVGGRSPLVAPFPATPKWPAHGVVARRSVLDNRILEAATSAGAEVRTATRVAGPLFVDGTCRGVRVRTSDGTDDVEAAWTIAADGATSSVARAAGLAPVTTARSGGGFWYAALRGYFGPVEPHRGADGRPLIEFYPLRTPRGRWLPAYGWVFPLPNGTANVGVDLPHSPALAACPDLRPAYDAFIARLRRSRPGFESADQEAPPQGALLPEATAGFRTATSGMLAVGDAAGLITPYSGEGILYALESAELAAQWILSGRSFGEVARGYSAAIRDAYGFQMASSLRIMKAMRKAPLAGAAAAVGLRSTRALKAAVRVMAYLIDDDPQTRSTVSRGYRIGRRLWERVR